MSGAALSFLLAGCGTFGTGWMEGTGEAESRTLLEAAELAGIAGTVARAMRVVLPPASSVLALRVEADEGIDAAVRGALSDSGYGITAGDGGIVTSVKVIVWTGWALVDVNVEGVKASTVYWRGGSGRVAPVVIGERGQ